MLTAYGYEVLLGWMFAERIFEQTYLSSIQLHVYFYTLGPDCPIIILSYIVFTTVRLSRRKLVHTQVAQHRPQTVLSRKTTWIWPSSIEKQTIQRMGDHHARLA